MTLLGIKQNMTTRFGKFNFKIPVTAISVDPNVVLASYDTKLVIGLGKRKKIKKTDGAYVKVAGYTPRFIKEVNWSQKPGAVNQQINQPKAGDKLGVWAFETGDEIKVTGTTKGRGFAGGVKRHGFHGGPKTHGQSDRHRAPGSIGAGTTPGRVYKGKRMAGHMGASQFTVTGLEVIEVDQEKNIVFVKGAVPGPRSGFVVIEKTGKVKGYAPPPPPNPKDDRPLDENNEKQAEKEAATTDNTEYKVENTNKSDTPVGDKSESLVVAKEKLNAE